MDKRLVGKWHSKDSLIETINIFNKKCFSTKPPKVKISIPSTGIYNFSPNCVYEKDGFFCFEVDDIIFRFQYADGFMLSRYTKDGEENQIKYERVSAIPEKGKYRYAPANVVVGKVDTPRLTLLKNFAKHSNQHTCEPYEIEYKLFEEAPQILKKYNYDSYIENKSGDTLAFALLDFVCDNFQHSGSIGMPKKLTVENIVEFCESHDNKTNCRGLAALLASLMRMNGIKASHITCIPYEEPFDDCHVVVDCILPSGTRVMFDPTYRLYLKDKKGNYVSLSKLRQMLISGQSYYPNPQASYNGAGFNVKAHRKYMTKNTLRFSRAVFNADGVDEGDVRRIELVPEKYPVEKFDEEKRKQFVFDEREFWG